MPSSRRLRLDELLVLRGLAVDGAEAEKLIRSGAVLLGTDRPNSPARLVTEDAELSLKQAERYVSRGGLKLEGALADFHISPKGLRCLDLGASTGGFSDCLLQAGAAQVTAVDVAYGMFAWKLRNDPRVTLLERQNVRDLAPDSLGERFDLLVCDLSFISLKPLFVQFRGFLKPDSMLVALIKPQFEADPQSLQDGVLRDFALHEKVLDAVLSAAERAGFELCGLVPSQLRGPAGNIEYFCALRLADAGLAGDTAASEGEAASSTTIAGDESAKLGQSEAPKPAESASIEHYRAGSRQAVLAARQRFGY